MGWYNRISNNCKKATFLIDKKNLEGISFLQQMELRIHLTGCSICRLYQKQSQAIDKLAGNFYTTNTSVEFTLDKEFKKALEKNILRELKKK